MGSNFANELADEDLFPELDLESAIGYHLQGNHYPPVPLSMVQPCIDAIDAYNAEDYYRKVQLPEGVSWKGMTKAPACAKIGRAHV